MHRSIQLLTVLILLIQLCAVQSCAATFNVRDFGAIGDGTADDSRAVQSAVDAAIKAGPGNTVVFPSGTYYLPSKGIGVYNSDGLTITGDTSNDTMLRYTRTQSQGFDCAHDNNLTLENISMDTSELGFTQGVIESIDRSAKTVTVSIEKGYPSLNDPFLKLTDDTNTFYTYSDPLRTNYDIDGGQPKILSITQLTDSTWRLTLDHMMEHMFVGERWLHNGGNGHGPDINVSFSTGTNTIKNVNVYGGIYEWGFIGGYLTGSINFVNFYEGPPPYQSDRLMDFLQLWDDNQGGSAALNMTKCTLAGSWDDCIDFGENTTNIKSQSASDPNQIVVDWSQTWDYKQGDILQFQNFTNSPTGAIYATGHINSVKHLPDNTYQIELEDIVTRDSGAFKVENPGTANNSDIMCDLSQTGPVTLRDCTFSTETGRVLLHTGQPIDVEGCTFKHFIQAGLSLGAGGELDGPNTSNNVTIKNNTFIDCQTYGIQCGGPVPGQGYTIQDASSNVDIEDNRFINGGGDPFEDGWPDCAPIWVANIKGLTIKNNWFENNWNASIYVGYCDGVQIANNTFSHPNEIKPSWATKVPDSSSVIDLSASNNVSVSGNLVCGAGAYTSTLVKLDAGMTGVTGWQNGVLPIDSPLALSLSYDDMVVGGSAAGSSTVQAPWKASPTQEWFAEPCDSAPGQFMLVNAANGKCISTGQPPLPGSTVLLANQSPAGKPGPDELWSLVNISSTTFKLLNNFSGLCVTVADHSAAAGARLALAPFDGEPNQSFHVVIPPHPHISSFLQSVTLNWPPAPYASSYTIQRANSVSDVLEPVASDVAQGPWAVDGLSSGAGYYSVKADGLPIPFSQSQKFAAYIGPRETGERVDIGPASNCVGVAPAEWISCGYGIDGTGHAFSESSVGSTVNWKGDMFILGDPGMNNCMADAGQRIVLPRGNFSSVLILADYLGTTSSDSATFTPTITYTDGSSATLTQNMVDWRGSAQEQGESDVISGISLVGGSGPMSNYYLHGYELPIDQTKIVQWLAMPATGKFRIFAIDLNATLSTLSSGASLVAGNYIASPSGACFLTQQQDGNLVLSQGAGPASKGNVLWSSRPNSSANGSYFTTLQPDGNLVTYQGSRGAPGGAVWASSTYGGFNYYLNITDSGEVQIMDGKTVIWQKP